MTAWIAGFGMLAPALFVFTRAVGTVFFSVVAWRLPSRAPRSFLERNLQFFRLDHWRGSGLFSG